MNMVNFSRGTYGQALAPSRSPRSLEYDLLARSTQALRQGEVARGIGLNSLAKALTQNLQVWTTLAADVAAPGNGLPAELRARLFYLYQFTELHSHKVLAGSATVEVLIDINTAVMRGLRGETGAAE